MSNVGIVIVSHSPKVAEGAADMVRQMVGDSVPLAWTGGNPEGGLGTDVARILEAIDHAWSEAGVAILWTLAAPKPTAKWPSRCSTISGAAGWWCAKRRWWRGR